MSELQCCLSAIISIHLGLVLDGHNPVREIRGSFCILGHFPCGESLSLDSPVQLLLLCSLLVMYTNSGIFSLYKYSYITGILE